jgi:competence protein ComEC
MIIIHNNINYFNFNPYVVFLDVGQGDSVFINLPNNQGNILIDTGGKMDYGNKSWEERNHKYKIGEDTIIPYLKSIGVKKLDYLILTHGDYDHMGESVDIVKQFKVQRVILNDGSLVDLESSLIKELKYLNIPYDFGKGGDMLKINNYSFNIINPSIDVNENDNSLVLYFEILNTRFLLTGDISTNIENKLISEYPILKADILKLGHHGSITSSSERFLDFVKPKYAIIQVGLNNHFNHPSGIVLDSLFKRNIKICQTSINGSIKIIIRANDITVIPFKT